MFQQSHSWADIKRKSQFKRIHVKKKKKDTRTSMFSAALFIAITWMQPKCPLTEE